MSRLRQRQCRATVEHGQPCGATPLRDKDLCFWHDPEHKEEADKARQLGGQRRRRESTLAGAYDVEGLTSTGELEERIANLEAAVQDRSEPPVFPAGED